MATQNTPDGTRELPPEIDDVIAITNKIVAECKGGDFAAVFEQAMAVYWRVMTPALDAAANARSPE